MNKCSGAKTYMSKLYIKSCPFPYQDLSSRETDSGSRGLLSHYQSFGAISAHGHFLCVRMGNIDVITYKYMIMNVIDFPFILKL